MSNHLVQPTVDYTQRLNVVAKNLDFHFRCSAKDFKNISETLQSGLVNLSIWRTFKDKVYLPVVIPQLAGVQTDYRKITEQYFLSVLHGKKILGREFINGVPINDKLETAPKTAQNILLSRLETGIVAGILIPAAFEEGSIQDMRNQFKTLPPGFVLVGAIEIMVAIAMYPDVFFGSSMEVFHCAGINHLSFGSQPQTSLNLEIKKQNFTLCPSASLAYSGENSFGGVLYIGEE